MSAAYTEAGAVLADFAEEARDTFRRVGRLLPGRRRVDELERAVRTLNRALELEAITRDEQARQIGRVTADLDELIGIAAAVLGYRDAELAGLLANDRNGLRRRALEDALELRERINVATQARSIGQARDAVTIMLGFSLDHGDTEDDVDAMSFKFTELRAKPPAARARLIVEGLGFDEEGAPSNLVSYLRDAIAEQCGEEL